MTQYAFYFDQSRCYGCQACSVACKDWNLLEPGPEKWMTVYDWETGAFPDLRLRFLAFGCAHCQKPLCARACANGAIFKEEKYGAVLVDPEKCQGDRRCLTACPYGSPKFASARPGAKMSKCSMCVDRLEEGQLPTCVSSCPLRAFDFGTLSEMEARYGTLRRLEGMPDPALTRPAFIVREASPKQALLPYDGAKALSLMQRCGEYDVFADNEDVLNVEAVRKTALVMKHASSEALMDATRNDLG
ncbi:MAG: 4Fe-4S dicluster domain-containing protein [Gracilibacteraceae bacterium]|jgi:anaerobic dimethyl sulfoxide reductase subunit B (iron-sulfur subunit)|nr:4Fe-4S dicluster domain-containing protein [Gracilibacteraceae bacterium]